MLDLQSNMPYELDAATLNTFGECDMNGQLHSPVLAAHYRVMPGGQQQQQQVTPLTQAPDGRTLVGFSFNTSFGSGGADMIFYEFAGGLGGRQHGTCCCQDACSMPCLKQVFVLPPAHEMRLWCAAVVLARCKPVTNVVSHTPPKCSRLLCA